MLLPDLNPAPEMGMICSVLSRNSGPRLKTVDGGTLIAIEAGRDDEMVGAPPLVNLACSSQVGGCDLNIRPWKAMPILDVDIRHIVSTTILRTSVYIILQSLRTNTGYHLNSFQLHVSKL